MNDYQWRLSVKYDPNQPRVPAGQTGGGRWTSEGGYGTGTVPEPGFGSGQETALFAEKWFTEDIPNRDWRGASDEVRGEVKARIVQELANRTRIDQNTVNMFIEQWSHSSNDNDMRSLAVQQDASNEFGVSLSDFTKDKVSEINAKIEHLVDEYANKRMFSPFKGKPDEAREWLIRSTPEWRSLLSSEQQKQLLRTMYDHTQEQLAAAGLQGHVTLYRGVKWLERDVDKLDPNSTISITGNAIESWSFSPEAAERFAKPRGNKAGVVLAMDIPIKAILGTAKTGFGCLTEAEFVVLGIDGQAQIRSLHFPEPPEWGEAWND